MAYLRIPFMLAAVFNLIAGIWAGLIRLGWDLPLTPVAVHHGAIMVGGFLTTLIALEKAIPLKKKLVFVVPVISALSLMMVVPGYYHVGLYFLLAGSVGLFIIHAYYLYLHPRDLSIMLMMVGAGCLIVGNAMLIQKQFYPAAFPWWMGFLLFTITAERIELSKFLPVSARMKNISAWVYGAVSFRPNHPISWRWKISFCDSHDMYCRVDVAARCHAHRNKKERLNEVFICCSSHCQWLVDH